MPVKLWVDFLSPDMCLLGFPGLVLGGVVGFVLVSVHLFPIFGHSLQPGLHQVTTFL